MSLAIVTGSCGLIGSQASKRFHELGFDIWGIDNDMRRHFFGAEASTDWMRQELCQLLPRYTHFDIDIRDAEAVDALLAKAGSGLVALIHTAAQPSHDWAAKEPITDFTVNANGTLVLLDSCQRHCSNASFIFTSTNKVYGDTPNSLPLIELATRYELPETHAYYKGIPESMTLDQSTHSLFGVSKVAADLLVQEYGRYFGMATGCFRGGCLTGPAHSGAELHGFLAYLMKCTATGRQYTVYGYDGKQVRDNIHSADLIGSFEEFIRQPRVAAVYNIGGGRNNSCSMLEAISLCEEIAGQKLNWTYSKESRIGDHQWWISDLTSFRTDYPNWSQQYDLPAILREIYDAGMDRWSKES